MRLKSTEPVKIDRAYSVYVTPQFAEPDEEEVWCAHILGPSDLDIMTQGSTPADALFMAFDALRMLACECLDGGEHDWEPETNEDTGDAGYACPRCHDWYNAVCFEPEQEDLAS